MREKTFKWANRCSHNSSCQVFRLQPTHPPTNPLTKPNQAINPVAQDFSLHFGSALAEHCIDFAQHLLGPKTPRGANKLSPSRVSKEKLPNNKHFTVTLLFAVQVHREHRLVKSSWTGFERALKRQKMRRNPIHFKSSKIFCRKTIKNWL